MSVELQPCQNCGGRARLHTKGYKVYFECDGDCWTRTKAYFSIEDAAREWNQPKVVEYKPELRRHFCPDCGHEWWEDRDASDYPNYCPECGTPLREEG